MRLRDGGDDMVISDAVVPPGDDNLPLVSLIVTTRDRPDFFPIALACCLHQTYPNREIIVVDDGEQFPVPAARAADAGFVVIQPDVATSLGTKLNLGCDAAWGEICLKIDDDDWYGPEYVATMVDRLLADWTNGPRASLLVANGFLLFDLPRWEIRRAYDAQYAGATLCFRREDWAACPFRPLANHEDVNFYGDQVGRGTRPLAIHVPESFLAVRHPFGGANRGHTWRTMSSAETVEEHLLERPLHERTPESLLPAWALDAYANLRHRLRQDESEGGAIVAGTVTTDLGLVSARPAGEIGR